MGKLFIMLLIPFASYCQKHHKDTIPDLPFKDGKVFYEKIFNDSGKSKNDLYIKAKDVFIRLFPASKDVIQNEDKENGIIDGKGYFSFYLKGALHVLVEEKDRFTIKIIVKDNKYKVELFDFIVVANDPTSPDYPIELNYIKRKNKKNSNSGLLYAKFNERVLQIFDQVQNEMEKPLSTDF